MTSWPASSRAVRSSKMAAGTRVDLDHAASCGADPLCVERGLLISLDHRHDKLARQFPRGSFEQRRLSCAGRAHEVDREDTAPPQPVPVALGERVVLREHLVPQDDGAAAAVIAVPVALVAVAAAPVALVAVAAVRVVLVAVIVA